MILMDIELPVMDGYTATKEIKKIRPELPVVAQTAFAMMGERERSQEAGCDEYISKPIRKDTLLEIISRFLWVQPDSCDLNGTQMTRIKRIATD